jgi:hypothetical protein
MGYLAVGLSSRISFMSLAIFSARMSLSTLPLPLSSSVAAEKALLLSEQPSSCSERKRSTGPGAVDARSMSSHDLAYRRAMTPRSRQITPESPLRNCARRGSHAYMSCRPVC